MHGDRSDPRAFWERGQGTADVAATPRRSARPVGAAPMRTAPTATTPPGTGFQAASGQRFAPATPPPSGPPARVGGAVAALVVAGLTLIVPALGLSLGLWFFVLVANAPGVVLGIMALRKIPDAVQVEKYIRYTWACNFAYVALSVVFAVPVIVFAALALLLGF
ncbi:hypothetical protein [Nocardiopsis sp. JB363]|uniref:hypothetical protein n=1 Tax=Nocardiopsis sp. JB363 TaxID=1434837 RepID=UPI000979FB70|nr:hypothetical protein BQ8420_07050 [Nocardiopsis sp. JB363]